MPKTTDLAGNSIIIKGANVNNLKNVDLAIPRDKFIVITGLSGSGKSSLAFDTIYAEGQRRYVESLSAYARQFLGKIQKPEVEYILGIPPAIAIEQKVNTRNPRSTVGTSTEVYDYLKLLYARIGKTISPKTGKEVKKHSVTNVVDFVLKQAEGTKLMVLSPINIKNTPLDKSRLESLNRQGFTRMLINKEIVKISDLLAKEIISTSEYVYIVIDRLIVQSRDEDFVARAGDSVQLALNEGDGTCMIGIQNEDDIKYIRFSIRYEEGGELFEEPNEHMFSFNNPIGACPTCEGYGKVIGIDEDKVVPNKGLSLYEDAVVCWKGDKMKKWKERFIMNADRISFPIHKPYYQLNKEQRELLWYGGPHVKGIYAFFHYVESKQYKIQYRVMLARYRGKTTCPECKGARLKKEAYYVKINNYTIGDLVEMPIKELTSYFKTLELDDHDKNVAKRLLVEINNRLAFLENVGLGYLTLNRLSATLSGGESQRINLATSLGSSLVGSLYILDEPSIGLHSRDTERLISVLKNLRDIGNSVVVVEHDEEIIRASDEIVDMGPFAGRLGGEVIFHGNHQAVLNEEKSLTAKYLSGKETIDPPAQRRKWRNYIHVKGARENNLKNISVKFPLNTLTVVSGVSGSGKSTLVKNILYSGLGKLFDKFSEKTGEHDLIEGDIKMITGIEFVDQNPIGKSSRSNPVTYLKVYDEIRNLYSKQQLAKLNNFKPAHFSFNVDGGRCDECQGEGIIKVEMQFMADVELICDSCGGKRFKDEVLEVKYRDKNIYDILEMTIDEAIEFFSQAKSQSEKKIAEKLQPLADVGLGYVKMGQSSSTLSGGESQRVKLAYFLSKESSAGNMLFIFDEPTTGLHFHDIKTLLGAFEALIQRGHSIVIIEHNLEIIKMADWIIDLGPEGGEEGGQVVFEGIPEDIVKCEKSYTGKYLKEKI
ncbi:MAG: excinuclease ABC subunit UvrA [Bacteroidales bacterium]|nr:excinuclease ABC subunit UvrA [Bacteroidales bacterium]